MSFKFLIYLMVSTLAIGTAVAAAVLLVSQQPVVEMVAKISYLLMPPSAASELVQQALWQSYDLAIHGNVPDDSRYLSLMEQSHLADVYILIWIVKLTGLFMVFIWVLLVIFWKLKLFDFDSPLLCRWVGRVGLGLLIGVGISLALFQRFFLWFHMVLFPQGNYSFPAQSLLIQAFPEAFWMFMLGVMGVLVMFLLTWCRMFCDEDRKSVRES